MHCSPKKSERRPLTDHSRAELARRRCHVAAAGCHWPPGCCSACITGANSLRGLCRGRHPVPSQRRSANQVPGGPANGRWPVPEALRALARRLAGLAKPETCAVERCKNSLAISVDPHARARDLREEGKRKCALSCKFFFCPDPVHASF